MMLAAAAAALLLFTGLKLAKARKRRQAARKFLDQYPAAKASYDGLVKYDLSCMRVETITTRAKGRRDVIVLHFRGAFPPYAIDGAGLRYALLSGTWHDA